MNSLFLTSTILAVAWAYVRHIQLPAGPTRLNWGKLVFGHRGCRGVQGVPENTLDAFKYALSRGAAGVEVDVRLSKDNELIIFHDITCNGHLNGVATTKRIDELTLLELKSFSLVADPTGEIRLPTLEESMLFCRENNLKMLIDIKEMKRPRLCAEKVLDLYSRYPEYMYEQTTVIAFNPLVLYHMRMRDQRVAVGQLHSGRVLRTLLSSSQCVDFAWYIRLFPAFFDWALNCIQERVTPWLLGVSLVCPHYQLFSEAYRRRWHTRKIGVLLWGFGSPDECTRGMRAPGVLVECDDRHDVFVDKIRGRERSDDE